MIAKNNQQDKSTAILKSLSEFFRDLNEKSREKMVQRQISAVQEFVEKSREKNPHFSWNFCPWPVQFLPVITKFFRDWGKINAVNPTLSGFSGLMGMSKIEMNQKLAEPFRPRNLFFKTLPKSREILEQFFREKYGEPPNYPVIFKPNVGERASGVNFVRADQIDEFLQPSPRLPPSLKLRRTSRMTGVGNQNLTEIIFEEFIETELEFGLSWIRNPHTEELEILSLVQKKTPRILGDGQKTLRELILEKCAELNLDKSREKKILAGFSADELAEKIVGEKNIVRTASVSYGTSFQKINLSASQKEKLIKLIPQLLENFAGIYAGRFDLKANNLEELLRGKCKILEMNGVGGTPLEIYDNDFSIPERYEVLFNYFFKVLEIADQNIRENRGQEISKLVVLKNLAKNFFGNSKTQELPENVWKNLREVIKISLKKRLKSSDLGKLWQKIKD